MIEFHAGSAEQLPAALRGRRFDAVVLCHVLEHCIQPLIALRNALQLLEPGGFLFCEVPNNAALGLKHRGVSWAMLDVPRHLHFFTRTSLTRFCERVGFEIHLVQYAHYHRQFTNDWIANEARLWNALRKDPACRPLPPRNTRLRAFRHLVGSLFAPRERKYDSVRVIARRPL